MSVYRKFTRNDILFSKIDTRPKVSVRYGLHGWEGNSGVSGSLSLYGGVRARYNVKASDFTTTGLAVYPLDELDTHSIDKVLFVSGSYPSTGSIRFVKCENNAFTSYLQVTDTHWYQEHYSPIELLYDYHSRFDENFFIGNYDFYSSLLLAQNTASYPGACWVFSGSLSGSNTVSNSSSWSIEAMIKPLPIDQSYKQGSNPFYSEPTIIGTDTWKLKISPTGTPIFHPDITHAVIISASNPTSNLLPGVWNHVVVVANNLTASIYVNGIQGPLQRYRDQDATFSHNTGSNDVPLIVGGSPAFSGSSRANLGTLCLNGYIFETKIWKKALTRAEVLLSLSGTLINSSSADLVHYARFNDGPLATSHGFTAGEGVFDHSTRAKHGYQYVASISQKWQPNDHPTFVTTKTRTNVDNDDIRVIHIPSMFYGSSIDPGSVEIIDGVYNNREIVRVFNDDGRGGLYVSGSTTRTISGEDYTGEKRRKVGNVFYSEGLITITDPALHDMFNSGSLFWNPNADLLSGTYPNLITNRFADLLSINFRGQGKLCTKTFNCRLPTGQGNASNNPTFSYYDDHGTIETDDDRVILERTDGVTYITAVGLYNEDRQLVAVAKLAQPIRKREKDKINIRLKMDF